MDDNENLKSESVQENVSEYVIQNELHTTENDMLNEITETDNFQDQENKEIIDTDVIKDLIPIIEDETKEINEDSRPALSIEENTRFSVAQNLGSTFDVKSKRSFHSVQDHYEKVFDYIRGNSKDDRISGLNDESVINMSLDLQECDLGQELLNELYNTRVSSDQDIDFENQQKFIQHQPRHLLNEVESISSSERLANRLNMISRIKELIFERKNLLDTNVGYQSKLVEYFKLVKAKQKGNIKTVSEKDFIVDFNTQYDRYREILLVLMTELNTETSKYQEKIEKLQSTSETKTKQIEIADKDFVKYQENVGYSALHSRTGFKLDTDVIRDFFVAESKKEAIIKAERLHNLKLEHKNARFDKALRSKENFEGGLRLIDFEQLKIENQTFNEKVEERCEAINKLNRKITNCNHLLSHIKEKISFTDHDKRISNLKLVSLNKDFKRLQKSSNKIKKLRDYIKGNNRSLQMQCGLLGKKDYLRKYEECYDDVKRMRNSIAGIEHNIHHLLSETTNYTNKINEAKKENGMNKNADNF